MKKVILMMSLVSLLSVTLFAGGSKVNVTKDKKIATRLFALQRDKPFRMVDKVPDTAVIGSVFFSAAARPGEFYVFQVGLCPSTETEPLSVRFSKLASDKGVIPTDAIRCISLGGIGADGKEFTKSIRVPANGVQILWCGIDVPVSAVGKYQGTVEIFGGATVLGKVDLTLTVEGSVLDDHGDTVAKNLSRLRWLDSNIGRESTVTAPFVPVKTKKRTISILGREVVLGDDGLPVEITSFFNSS